MKRNDWWMYFVQGEHSQNIKIGIATCPYRRVVTLQGHCTERLILLSTSRIVSGNTEQDARDAESLIHRQFEDQRLYGEMFAPSPQLLRLAQLKRTGPTHQCSRCPKTPHTDDPPNPLKPIPVSMSSKVRHIEKRRIKHPETPTLYHSTLPRAFFPRRDRDEYGGKVQHLRPGVSLTTYSNRSHTYKPSLG